MIRILIEFVVPFLLPLAAYSAWIWYRNKYAEQHEGAPPKFEEGPWPLMLFIGTVLMFATMVVTALTSGGSPHSKYEPPHVEDGKVVPGRMIDQ